MIKLLKDDSKYINDNGLRFLAKDQEGELLELSDSKFSFTPALATLQIEDQSNSSP